MKYLIHKTWEILWKSDTLFMEFWVALYTSISGLMFLTGRIDSYYTGSVYELISSVISQQIWGTFMTTLGLIQLIVLYHNRFASQKWVFAFSTVFWVFTGSIVGFGNGKTWIFFNIIMVAFAHIWLYLRTSRKLRIRKEVRDELELHREYVEL
jgi:hypothetical protein